MIYTDKSIKEAAMNEHKRSFLTDLIIYLTLIVLIIAQTSCEGAVKGVSSESADSSFFAMDTYITVKAYGENAKTGAGKAREKITALEKLWSVTDTNSEIYAANHNGTAKLSPETAEIVRFTLEMCKATDGALDISLYPVLTAWGFTAGEHHVPTDEELSELLHNVGYDRITLDGSTLTVPGGMQIDLGAIGKGYAGDLAARELRESGVTSALIDLGGNIQTIGAKPDGSAWKVGIRSPFDSGSFATLSVTDKAVVTSGGYERYFEQDGEIYWHILDPKTGKPVHSGLLSVTVIGDEGRLCDAFSTSLFVMGIGGAERLWREQNDFDFIALTDGGEIFITAGIEDSFELNANYTGLNVSVIR